MNFLIISLLFFDYSIKYYLILIFGFIITLLSFFDDFYDVSPKIRLVFQILIGAIIGITTIKIGYISNIFGGIINLETYYFTVLDYNIYIIPLVFTIFWYVLIFNSINWSDGVTGMTSGLSFVSFLILFILAYMLFLRDDYEGALDNAELVMGISTILLGSLLVFWWYNVRDKILMGDSGSMFLGFMLATSAIIAGGKVATLVVVLGIYLVDAFYVIIRRLLAGKSPMSKDFTHLHHRLEKAGFSKSMVLGFVYILSFLFGLAALFLDKVGKIIVFIIIVFVVVFVNNILEFISKKGK